MSDNRDDGNYPYPTGPTAEAMTEGALDAARDDLAGAIQALDFALDEYLEAFRFHGFDGRDDDEFQAIRGARNELREILQRCPENRKRAVA